MLELLAVVPLAARQESAPLAFAADALNDMAQRCLREQPHGEP